MPFSNPRFTYLFTFCVRHLQLVAGFATETEVETFFTREESQIALGAVVFDRKSFVGDKIRSDATVTYKIRLRSEDYDGKKQYDWWTSREFPISLMSVIGPPGDMYGPVLLRPGYDAHSLFIRKNQKTRLNLP